MKTHNPGDHYKQQLDPGAMAGLYLLGLACVIVGAPVLFFGIPLLGRIWSLAMDFWF